VLLEAANIASGMGNGIVMVVIPWLVLERTGSALAAGLVAALSSLPALLVLPVIGQAIDRFGSRRISILSDLASAVSVVGFPAIAWAVGLSYPWIIALAVLGAAIDPAGYTARKALIEDAARSSRMSTDSLNGIHEGLFAAGWTVGPLIGAALIATVGPIAAFWVPAALFLIAATCIAAITVGRAPAPREEPTDAGASGDAVEAELDSSRGSGWRQLVLGVTLLWHDRALRSLTIAVMVLAGVYLPTEAVVLPFYFESLDRPDGLGLVIGALAGGSVAGAFAYGWLSRRMTRYALVRLALIGTVVSMVPLAMLPPLPLMIVAGALLGLSWGPMTPLLNTLVQVRVPKEAQGRVFSIQLSTFYAFPPIAMLITGAAIERWDVGSVYLAIAGLVVLTVAVTLSLRSIRGINA
jgi:MFS family permease